MKKYRYGDPTKAGFFKKYGTFMYFFAAWNLLGLAAWKTMNANKSSKDKDWDKKPASEKYLSLIGYGQENTKGKHVIVKVHGLHVETNTEERKT